METVRHLRSLRCRLLAVVLDERRGLENLRPDACILRKVMTQVKPLVATVDSWAATIVEIDRTQWAVDSSTPTSTRSVRC